jgi:RNA polymerase sigma-54 factor
MKQSLQLKLGQQLTMTPQLQQAIKLLQLSTLDLQLEIQQAIESNPLLELEEEFADDTPISDTRNSEGPMDSLEHGAADTPAGNEDWEQSIPDELPVDTQWDDLLPSSSSPAPASNDDELEFDYAQQGSADTTLQEHLLWQLNLTHWSEIDRMIAVTIIDYTDENGRLTADLEEIYEVVADEGDIDFDEVVAVLHGLQQFEPTGVFAKDLQECLHLQLRQLPTETPHRDTANLLLTRYMSQFGAGDYKQIMRRARLSEDELKAAISLIQTLDPNPGQTFYSASTEYAIPDVFVSKKHDRWVVELNPDIAPKLRINDTYASMIQRADNSDQNNYLRDNLQEARWFLKSLLSRNETLMKVATKIVEHQRGFLEQGEIAMRPLILSEIAEQVEMHESTISRATTNKYMHTPRGVFELKYFFSSHVRNEDGSEHSSTAIQALIKRMVSEENQKKPLSDSKIVTLLAAEGITVARRTIAKYRDILHIPPSNERKRLV